MAARVCARMTGAGLTNGAESLLSVRDACASPSPQKQEEHADYRRPVDTSRSRQQWLSCRTSRHGSPRVGPKVEPSVVRPTRGSAGSWGTRCRSVLWVAPAMGLGGQSKTLAVPHSDSVTKLSTRAEPCGLVAAKHCRHRNSQTEVWEGPRHEVLCGRAGGL